MKYLQPKSPDDIKFYVIDYSKLVDPDAIQSIIVSVSTGTVDIVRQVYNNNSIGLMLSGGANNETAVFDITINTVGMQLFTDQATITIADNANYQDFSFITKNQIVLWAWQDLRLSGYIFDHTSDENQAMLDRLDGLMRKWRLQGRDPGYNHPKMIGESVLNEAAGFEDGLGTSVATCLAKEYIDGIGKSITSTFITKLKKAESFLYSYTKGIPNRILPANTPHGAGMINWSIYFPFFSIQTTSNKASLLTGLSGSFIQVAIWDVSVWG